jgi:membrane protein implicated in regulation of membrane protease activity
MTWADFYLACFVVGFLLSAFSILSGHAHLHIGRGHMGHGHLGKGAAGGKGPSGGRGAHVSVFNFGTATAFLTWFGGAGYLLSNYSPFWIWLALAGAVGAGVVGAAGVFWFLSKLIATERALDPADYELIGALGRLSTNIRQGGTGEMIFSQQGSRRSIGARSDGGEGIPKGTEVVITRYEKGIAYVRRWDELAGQGTEEDV